MLRGVPRIFITPAATEYTSAGPNLKSEIRNPKSRGFTLLEVILALGLSGLVLVAVAMALDIHLRLVDSNRTGVEEARLARVLLDHIAEDLTNVVQKPIDVEKLVTNVTSQGTAAAGAAGGTAGAAPTAGTAASAPTAGGTSTGGTSTGGTSTGGTSTGGTGTGGTSAGGTGTGGTSTGGTGTGTSSTGTTGSDSTATGTATSAQAQSPPGLYGTASELQVDTSRLPRIDEIQGMLNSEGSAVPGVLSDVKTVSYYVINDQVSGAGYAAGLSQAGTGLSQTGTGLVRLEFDRATAAWLAQQGQLVAMTQDVEPIAPEVADIEFRYFDGTELLEEWDSSVRGGLPVAVEITLYIIPARHRNDPGWTSLRTTLQGPLASTQGVLVFRRLVYLPTAQPTTADTSSTTSDTSSEETAEGSTGTTGQGSTGGSTTGGGSGQ
jgi:prepilin-type N-terminal cleavage/methylation domain-containing protein